MDILYSLPPRSFFIGFGLAAAWTVLLVLIFIEYGFTLRSLAVGGVSATVIFTCGFGGQLARKLTHGGWLYPKEFISAFFEYEGTHYIGAVLWIIWLSPLIWRLVMRRDGGVFKKEGLKRHMGMLSVYTVIQGFFGRMGCLPAGCCHGRPYHGPLAVPAAGLDHTVMPAVQTELVLLAVTAAAVVFAYIKKKNAKAALCFGYGISVFVSEFMYDRIGTVTVMGLTVIQILAAALILTGAVSLKNGRKIRQNV